ncbi:MAG: PVC-type heme-binding CxxCH protein [Rubripirellula sp.]
MLTPPASLPIRCFLFGFLFLLCPLIAQAQRELTDIPKPDPVAEKAAMKVHELAAVNLYGANPDFSKPIQMNFDSTGGLWIASSEVYPQILPGEKADDKIVVLRDTDGDGVADSRTVFADGLLIPTGVIPDGPNAAYIAESTRILYLQDTDGDGKADKREVVLSGFGTEDTHHLVHTLRMGPDGCLYFNQSIYIHSHIDTPFGTRHLDGGGIWRYRPSTRRLEVVCKGFVNPWGHVFDAVGESFATDGAYFEGINYVFPDSVFVTSPGATRWLKGLNPGSPKHCGLEILSGTHIPPEWYGEMVANDFRSHRVCRFTVKPSGTSYLSRQQPEILTTQHVAFRPIDARMGPDGALYVADWYNPIIQHGEVDFRDERRDRKHGRIWRVSFPGRELDPWPDFKAADVDGLLTMLEDSALHVRQFARQELWQRIEQDPTPVRAAMANWAGEKPQTRILERYWLNEVIGSKDASEIADIETLEGIEPTQQRTLLRSAWRRRQDFSPADQQMLQLLVTAHTKHADPRVRLEAVAAAGQIEGSADDIRKIAAFERVLEATDRDLDPNLDFAVWQSIRQLDAKYSSGSILTAMDWAGKEAKLAHAVSAISTPAAAEVAVKGIEAAEDQSASDALVAAVALAGNGQQLGRVVRSMISRDARDFSSARFKPLLDRTRRDGTIPAGVGPLLAKTAAKDSDMMKDAEHAGTLALMAGIWKIGELETPLVSTLDTAAPQVRNQLIAALGSFDSDSAKKTLTRLAGDADVATRVAATRAIAASRPWAAVGPVVDLLQDDATGDAGADIVVSMLGRKEISKQVGEKIASVGLSTDRARSLLRQVRSGGGNAGLEQAIRAAGKLENASWKLTPELKAELLALAKSSGSPERGEAIYRQEKLQCIKCHAIGNAGGVVGPNLISMGGSSQPDYIVESLLLPSAKLKEGYTTLSVLTDSGELINGILIGRNAKTVSLRLADGKEVQIAADSIEQEKPGKSLMPEGLLDTLTKTDLVDLIAFMSALGRTPEYTVSTESIVRQFESLIYTNEANRRLNRTSTDTAASDDPAMQWKPLTSKVDGTLPISELAEFKQHRQTPPTSFARFTINLPAAGTAQIELPNEGIEAWVDTKPTPVWELKSLKLPAGDHTIVFAIDRTKRKEPFKVQLGGDVK